MTIEELKEKRSRLTLEIADAIALFETETSVSVREVFLDISETSAMGTVQTVVTSVAVEVAI